MCGPLGTAVTDNCRDPFFTFNFEFLEKNSLTRCRYNKGLQSIKKIFS